MELKIPRNSLNVIAAGDKVYALQMYIACLPFFIFTLAKFTAGGMIK